MEWFLMLIGTIGLFIFFYYMDACNKNDIHNDEFDEHKRRK